MRAINRSLFATGTKIDIGPAREVAHLSAHPVEFRLADDLSIAEQFRPLEGPQTPFEDLARSSARCRSVSIPLMATKMRLSSRLMAPTMA